MGDACAFAAGAGPAGAARGGNDDDAGAFKSSAKGAAVARAFARIMEKTRPDDRGLGILSVGAPLRDTSKFSCCSFRLDLPNMWKHSVRCHLCLTTQQRY